MLPTELRYAALAFIIVLLLCYLCNLSKMEYCTVIITGESVKLLNCDFNRDFIEFAKGLKPFGSL
ncbi:TGB3 [Allium carlavirus A]|nr:TGB3 [Allium carlavirus A]